ncbi:hypothetical protein [Agromyces sp. ZXT2-3]|uniref:hypothetical protein n=1 Tax=Agromyces sp. ZXT2-3 TaxID=3461152 RepID=UPI004054F2F6
MFGTLFNAFSVASSPEILEIRVHGVRNTPPAEMLETAPDEIERVAGDDLGSFWRRRGERPQRGIRSIEAFSWGAQARTGGGALAALGRAVVHVGWFLLLPYALANLGYWTRRIDPQPGSGAPASAGAPRWNGDFGAATVRVFGLLLTLIAVAAFCSVAIDLIGIQCFRDGEVCAALPSVFDGLVDLERDRRAALFGLAPIATVVVLYLIARRGRVAYEERVKQFGTRLDARQQEANRPLLATRGFWTESRIGQTSEWLHVSGAIALVLFLLALDSAYLEVDACWTGGSSSITGECLAAGFGNPLAAWFAVGAVVLLVAIVILVALASHTTSDLRTTAKRMSSMACLVVAIAAYLLWTWLTFQPVTAAGGDGKAFLGLIGTPIALVVLALFLALAGAGWKSRSWTRRAISAVLLVGGAGLLLGSHVRLGDERWLWVGGAVVCVLLHLLIAWTTPRDHRFEAWRGQGAAVAMLLALFASMALSSLLVLGVASWLGTSTDDAETDYIWRTPLEAQPERSLDIPDAYERFAVVLTAIALLMVVLILTALVVNMLKFVRFSLPPSAWSKPSDDDDEQKPADERGGLETPDPATYAPRLTVPDARNRRRLTVRRSSHLLHRGEPLFGWLAVLAAIGFMTLSSAVVFEGLRAVAARFGEDVPANIRTASTAVLVAVAVAAVAAVVTHAASSSERPLGVFWDVVAFFPRAGHPFAPPCFGERVVPELAARTRAWLVEPSARRRRGVILTAHSMGSTISAATLMAMRGDRVPSGAMADEELVDRIALLSYGTQLRAYFSRFFPSVFGPKDLGVPGTLGPSLWSSDPWRRQVLAEFREGLRAPSTDAERSLTGMLGAHDREVPRWRSLWRRTDYLGFPVYGYPSDGNPIDRGVTESAPASYLWRIATHGDYLGTEQFLIARDELVDALGAPPTGTPS